ncbi:hypothetical protein BGZ63DRAFT_372466 [Mariannaea sp. PMI_226]|nr:hypothetical protein BGZ63DRAFT_372466 [Mariannaea sp. PMI_226]
MEMPISPACCLRLFPQGCPHPPCSSTVQISAPRTVLDSCSNSLYAHTRLRTDYSSLAVSFGGVHPGSYNSSFPRSQSSNESGGLQASSRSRLSVRSRIALVPPSEIVLEMTLRDGASGSSVSSPQRNAWSVHGPCMAWLAGLAWFPFTFRSSPSTEPEMSHPFTAFLSFSRSSQPNAGRECSLSLTTFLTVSRFGLLVF